jgi:hypothetical protein
MATHAMALADDRDPVIIKLRDDILPWVESAKLLRQAWFYRLHVVFGYTTDLTIALGTIGISLPILQVLRQTEGADDGQGIALASALPKDPFWLYAFAFSSVLIWVFLRVLFNREEGQKKAVLARSCVRTMEHVDFKIHQILMTAQPIDALNELLEKTISPTIDRNVQEGSYNVDQFSQELIDGLVEKRLNSLNKRYGSKWAKQALADFRRAPAEGAPKGEEKNVTESGAVEDAAKPPKEDE